jgi:hypothetical protein
MKDLETPLVEKEGIAKIFTGDKPRQVKPKKITQNAKIEINKFKEDLSKLEDTPENVRDSEAILIAIKKSRKELGI